MRATPWGTYSRIAASLRLRVAELAAGSPLPSESALAAEFKVVRNTVRRALAELEREGLIETLPGRGRVVRSPGQAAGPPTYRRIADDLRSDIASGALGPGDRVPSEAELVARYGISRGTARQGLAAVEAAGLIVARHGKGRYVSDLAAPGASGAPPRTTRDD